MGISVEIVSVGQQLDVDTGRSFNTLVFRLSGRVFDAMVDDAAVELVTGLIGQGLARRQVANPIEPVDQPPPSPEMSAFNSREAQALAGDGALMTSVFGAESEGAKLKVSDFPMQPVQPPAQHGSVGILSEPPERLSVMKNEMGYPIIRGANRKDVGEVVGTGEQDEDGVASL